ncbi:MAG: peptidase dimerization domain-containing protein [Solirubrobacteraceae bacterium]
MTGPAGATGAAVLTPDASIVRLFCELVSIPSPSGRELALAREIEGWLATHGVGAQRDRAGEVNESDAGNLIATVTGTPGAPTLLFVAHMDTVESGNPAVSPQVGEDGVIRSDGETILGADNKAAVAAVMRLCARAARGDAGGTGGDGAGDDGAGDDGAGGGSAGGGRATSTGTRPTIVAAFTCREESGPMGVALLDQKLLAVVDCAFCVDGARPIGTVITRALGQSSFGFAVRGRAAHAAANPEAGVNAIRVAAEIVAALELGRLPGGGSTSVAAIAGGGVIDRLGPATQPGLGTAQDASGETAVRAALAATATNSIPDLALVRGEVRAFTRDDLEAAMAAIEATGARICQAHGAGWEWARDPGRVVPPFPEIPGSRALALVRDAVARVDGIELACEQRHATLEANHLAGHVDVVAVASGGRDPHQRSESIPVVELERLEALLAAIVQAAA